MQKLITLSISVFMSVGAHADIYKYIDPSGHVHYTDRPAHRLYKRVIRSRPESYARTLQQAKYMSKNKLCSSMEGSYRLRRMIRKNCSSYLWENTKFNKRKYSNLIAEAASKHNVDEKLLHAVIQAESAYHAQAVSSAGAVGLMQLMPDTARRYGVTDRSDPVQNIEGGTRYLRDLLKMFNLNLPLAVAAYNAGENAVKKYNNAIPPYPETQNYVKQVLALYRR